MQQVRAFIRRHQKLALGLVLLALMMKAVIPAGFMPAAPGKVLTVMLCDGQGDQLTTRIALPGGDHDGSAPAKSAMSDGTCAYAGLSFAALGGVDGLLAAALVLFILALGFAPARIPALRRVAHAQPPQCGPPALA